MARGPRVPVLEFIERFQAEPRLRQRVVAVTGVSVFFAAGLIVAGLGQVVLAAVGLAGLGGVLTLVAWSVSRDDFRRVIRAARSGQRRQRLSTLVTGAVTSAKSQSKWGLGRTWATASTAAARGQRAPNVREPQSVAKPVPPPTADELYSWPYAGSDETTPTPSLPEPPVEEQRRPVSAEILR